MSSPSIPPHLQALEEVEQAGILGLVEGLREEGLDGVRYTKWDATGWHRDYSPVAWRNRATEEQKRLGWEMAVRIEKILVPVLHEAHARLVEVTMQSLSEGPESFYESPLDLRSGALRGPGSSYALVHAVAGEAGLGYSAHGKLSFGRYVGRPRDYLIK